VSRIVRKRKDLRGSTQRPCCEEVPEDGGARHESPDDIRAEIPACVWFRNCARRIPVHCCRPLTEVRAGNLLPRGPVWSSTVVMTGYFWILARSIFSNWSNASFASRCETCKLAKRLGFQCPDDRERIDIFPTDLAVQSAFSARERGVQFSASFVGNLLWSAYWLRHCGQTDKGAETRTSFTFSGASRERTHVV